MYIDQYIKIFAGSLITTSVVLSHLHSPYWLLLTLFIGLNLLQFGFTDFCPLAFILERLKIKKRC